MQDKHFNFTGKIVFIGLDLHKKTWYLTARCEGIELKQWSMSGNKEQLVNALNKLFAEAAIVLFMRPGVSATGSTTI